MHRRLTVRFPAPKFFRIQQYSKYVDELGAANAESAPGCESCTPHRLLLEQAWQIVANEFYDPSGNFKQSWWAAQLEGTLKVRRLVHECWNQHGITAFPAHFNGLYCFFFGPIPTYNETCVSIGLTISAAN